MEEREEIVSSKAIQENSEVFEFHIDSYERKELYGSAFELVKRSVIIFFLILLTLIVGPYMLLSLLLIILDLLLGKIEIRDIIIFCKYSIFLIPCWVFTINSLANHLRKYTRDLCIKINSERMILSSENRYNEIDIKNIKVKEKKNGIILIFKRATDQRMSKKLNFRRKMIAWYDCIPLLKSNFSENEIEQIKNLINRVVDMEEKEEIISSKAIQENSEVFEFHIDSYEKKELYGSAFELIKRSSFLIVLILFTLIVGPYMLLSLLVIVLDLLLGNLDIRFILMFCISTLFVIPWWIIVEYKCVFVLRDFTKNLSIKIYNDSILLSSENYYKEIDKKNIKIKEKKNGILLLCKRVENQKRSKQMNFMSKIYFWYDCVPLLKSNFSVIEIEQIKSLINQNSTKA